MAWQKWAHPTNHGLTDDLGIEMEDRMEPDADLIDEIMALTQVDLGTYRQLYRLVGRKTRPSPTPDDWASPEGSATTPGGIGLPWRWTNSTECGCGRSKRRPRSVITCLHSRHSSSSSAAALKNRATLSRVALAFDNAEGLMPADLTIITNCINSPPGWAAGRWWQWCIGRR